MEQKTLGQVFDHYQKQKVSVKDLREMIRDQYRHDSSWNNLDEEIKKLRRKQRLVEMGIEESLEGDLEKLLKVKTDRDSTLQLATDLVIKDFLDGKPIQPIVCGDFQYLPELKVKFIKMDDPAPKEKKNKKDGKKAAANDNLYEFQIK